MVVDEAIRILSNKNNVYIHYFFAIRLTMNSINSEEEYGG